MYCSNDLERESLTLPIKFSKVHACSHVARTEPVCQHSTLIHIQKTMCHCVSRQRTHSASLHCKLFPTGLLCTLLTLSWKTQLLLLSLTSDSDAPRMVSFTACIRTRQLLSVLIKQEFLKGLGTMSTWHSTQVCTQPHQDGTIGVPAQKPISRFSTSPNA